jgi:hypothetical protein
VRCRTTATITSRHLVGPHEDPAWYYALDEGVRQALKHHASVPLLTVERLAVGATSVLTMTDHEVELRSGDVAEIDVWTIIDARIILGEAKDANELGTSRADRTKTAHRLRHVADAFTADEFVFATTRAAWSDATIQAVGEAFAGSRTVVRWEHNLDADWQRAGSEAVEGG